MISGKVSSTFIARLQLWKLSKKHRISGYLTLPISCNDFKILTLVYRRHNFVTRLPKGGSDYHLVTTFTIKHLIPMILRIVMGFFFLLILKQYRKFFIWSHTDVWNWRRQSHKNWDLTNLLWKYADFQFSAKNHRNMHFWWNFCLLWKGIIISIYTGSFKYIAPKYLIRSKKISPSGNHLLYS